MEPIVIAIIGSGALSTLISAIFTAIANRKSRLTAIEGKLDELGKKITDQGAKEDEREAVTCRVRILRFEDDLRDNRQPSYESFMQVLEDITTYENFSSTHPDFPNSKTVMTIDHIKSVYKERYFNKQGG